ncbi:uracil phosphoribosyltransferase [Favolaschia claudopus]|uniref:Uracil phosphoribosyltransferase n=1 Tax=Favolaschia claudopus TaxID=2862362 RepID=A0AAW0BB73_9AGAR
MDVPTPTFSTPAPPAISPACKPTVIGVYGVSGCGKSHLLNHLENSDHFGEDDVTFIEGSAILSSLVPGGLPAFKLLPDPAKHEWREKAITHIQDECAKSGKTGVVAGHFMFWETETDDESAPSGVWTQGDASVFTHIIYLDVPPPLVVERRAQDAQRRRPALSEAHIQRWQVRECEELRRVCLQNKIIFTTAAPQADAIESFIRVIQHSSEASNISRVQGRLDEVVAEFACDGMRRDAMLVFDGDKTLIAGDTGKLFWELAFPGDDDPLTEVFSSPLGYTYTAFLQAAFLYSALDPATFDQYCEEVVSLVSIRPEMLLLLREAAERRVPALVVTCGVCVIWEKILLKAGLAETVKVIAGGRVQDELVVTAQTKCQLVKRLQTVHRCCVVAFGDSTLDLPMLKAAGRAVVVVGEETTRSRSMEAALMDAVVNEGLKAEQWVFPDGALPRLAHHLEMLPVFRSSSFLDSTIRLASRQRVLHTTHEYAAKLLMTSMRNAQVCGLALQQAHADAGWHLATTLLPKLVDLEEAALPHVQGGQTTGYRIRGEEKTVVVALMRGGEPMARGVWRAVPGAMFVHAKKPEELTPDHLADRETVLLVDSVVNSGKSVKEFVQRIRSNNPSIRIVVVTGVVQSGALESGGVLGEILVEDENVGVVALRVSENKYTGKGGSDTGNRLFNSTHLD